MMRLILHLFAIYLANSQFKPQKKRSLKSSSLISFLNHLFKFENGLNRTKADQIAIAEEFSFNFFVVDKRAV